MEKYSAFRDKGTGIQPFLAPIPLQGDDTLAKVFKPLMLISAILRTILFAIVLFLYIILTRIACMPFLVLPPIHDAVSGLLNRIFSRLFLFIVGFLWISPEYVTRKHGRFHNSKTKWVAKAGDVIISNWVSWIEVLWLTFWFNPVFVLPVVSYSDSAAFGSSSPVNRRQDKSLSHRAESTLLGYKTVTVFDIVRATGFTPPYNGIVSNNATAQSLSSIRSRAKGPVVVFPEYTTSNGRGLLQFVDFQKTEKLTAQGYNTFVMAVRLSPPTPFAPTASLSIPYGGSLNPIAHVFNLCSSLTPQSISIRLFGPSESSSEVLLDQTVIEDTLSEALSVIVANLGKLKKTSLNWAEKTAFLNIYKSKTTH